MEFTYDIIRMKSFLGQIIREQASPSWNWLQQQREQLLHDTMGDRLNLTFTAIPRFVKRNVLVVTDQDMHTLSDIRKGFTIRGWTLDRLARTWWLLQLPVGGEKEYVGEIGGLFSASEMNELVALYGALPLLAYPKAFRAQAAEGVRTNMGVVFEAVALHNPYPAEYLDEAAWNQLVLKAFFMDKPVQMITGLEERSNTALAHILSDYAHERWAAGRLVNPLLWWPVGRFTDEKIFPDMERLFATEDPMQQAAAALACRDAAYAPAKEALDGHPALKGKIERGELTWKNIH